MFLVGLAVGATLRGVMGIVIVSLAVAGKKEDEQMAAWFEKESEDKRCICFLDEQEKQLFSIPDGDCIGLAAENGEQQVCICHYVDAAHVQIHGEVWELLHFAKEMKQRGITYYPLLKSGTKKEGIFYEEEEPCDPGPVKCQGTALSG